MQKERSRMKEKFSLPLVTEWDQTSTYAKKPQKNQNHTGEMINTYLKVNTYQVNTDIKHQQKYWKQWAELLWILVSTLK